MVFGHRQKEIDRWNDKGDPNNKDEINTSPGAINYIGKVGKIMYVTFVKSVNILFSFEDIAMEFIRDNPNRQREFLEWIATYYRHDMTKERWQSQCHSIANNQYWIPKNKDDCIDMLETLIHELKNSKGKNQ